MTEPTTAELIQAVANYVIDRNSATPKISVASVLETIDQLADRVERLEEDTERLKFVEQTCEKITTAMEPWLAEHPGVRASQAVPMMLAELERYREALRWYANPAYEPDDGRRAREALGESK